MKSKILSSDTIKAESRRQLWIPAFIALGFLLVFPVAMTISLGNWKTWGYTAAQMDLLYEALWTDSLMFLGYLVLVPAALLNAVQGFYYLYFRDQVDYYHALPIRRGKAFGSRVALAVMQYLIPYVIMEFLAVCIGAMRGFFSLSILRLSLIMLLTHLLLYLLIYFSVVLVICLTGNILTGCLYFGGLIFYGLALCAVINLNKEVFFNRTYMLMNDTLTNILLDSSPIFLGARMVISYGNKSFALLAVAAVILTLIFAVLSCLAYIRRASESTGKPLIYPTLGYLLKFMVAIPCGLGVGYIFHEIPMDGSANKWWIFGLILGCVLAAGMVEVIYQLDFRKFFSHKIQLALILVLTGICALCFSKDLLHYDEYIPSYNQLTGIQLTQTNSMESNGVLTCDEDGYYTMDYGTNSDSSVLSNGNQEVGRSVYAALQSIAEKDPKETTGCFEYLSIRYVLKSGRSVYRTYYASSSDVYALYKALYEETNFKQIKYSVLDAEESALETIDLFSFADYNSLLFYSEPDKRSALLKAYKEDLADASADDLLAQPCGCFYLEYRNLPQKETASMISSNGTPTVSPQGYFFLYPSFTRTLKILKEAGISLSVDDVSITSAKVEYYAAAPSDNGENQVSSQPVSLDQDQIQELKNSLVSTRFYAPWRSYEACDIILTIEGSEDEHYYYVDSESEPDFLKELIEKMKSGTMEETVYQDSEEE